jgi:putative ABC transport system permease protein
LVGILIAVFLISTTISGNIFSDYKLIGVLKAHGLTPRNIITIFIIQYLLLSIVFIPLGLLGSFFIIKALFASLVKSIGMTDLDFNLLVPFVGASISMLAVTLLVSWYCGRKAGKIKPAKAIRDGAPVKEDTNQKPPGFLTKSSWSLPALLGIHFLFTNRRRSWILQDYCSRFLYLYFLPIYSIHLAD